MVYIENRRSSEYLNNQSILQSIDVIDGFSANKID